MRIPRAFGLGLPALAALFLSAGLALAQEPPLTIKVITGNEANLHADFTLVMGKQDALLVDAPFTRAGAYRLVADILETGKTLKYVYITHSHPDHFFSLDVIADAFPDAQLISAPAVVDDIWYTIPHKIKRWGPMLGANGPKHPVAPRPLDGDHFQLEGQDIQVLGPMTGDNDVSSALYIPSLKALVAGDIVFNQIHLWLGESTPEMRAAWLKSIDQLMAMKPEIVVAGHKLPGLSDGPEALQFTHDYLIAFNEVAKTAKTSEEMIAEMRKRFPDTQDVLDNFILVNSAQVATGEIPPWEE